MHPIKPTSLEVSQTIAYIRQTLAKEAINKPINRAIKEGYTEAVDILIEGRERYEDINELSTKQGRAIAIMAIDYNRGEVTQKAMVGIGLK